MQGLQVVKKSRTKNAIFKIYKYFMKTIKNILICLQNKKQEIKADNSITKV